MVVDAVECQRLDHHLRLLMSVATVLRVGTAVDKQTVRVTVDLDRPMHKALRMFAVESESDGSAVIRALLTQLEADPVLAQRIQAELR